jgi:predicted glutamine amidotransferase
MIDANERADTVIISSERLSDDPGWEPLEPSSFVLIGPDRRPKLRRFSPLPASRPQALSA